MSYGWVNMKIFLCPFISSCVSVLMQPSYRGLSLVTEAGFLVTALRQSHNPPNQEVQIHPDHVKSMVIIFFDIKGIVHKNVHLDRPNSQFRMLL
jgi:hypothetical protein